MSGLAPGDRAPAFSLRSDDGGQVSLGSLRGQPVVVYFYPKDDTSGCTTEACEFRDHREDLGQVRAVVLGVSPDSVESHARFRVKYRLTFRLLSDPDHTVAEAYGAWGEKSMYGRKYMGILRSTFVVDARGIIRAVFRKVKPRGHAAEVLAALEEIAT